MKIFQHFFVFTILGLFTSIFCGWIQFGFNSHQNNLSPFTSSSKPYTISSECELPKILHFGTFFLEKFDNNNNANDTLYFFVNIPSYPEWLYRVNSETSEMNYTVQLTYPSNGGLLTSHNVYYFIIEENINKTKKGESLYVVRVFDFRTWMTFDWLIKTNYFNCFIWTNYFINGFKKNDCGQNDDDADDDDCKWLDITSYRVLQEPEWEIIGKIPCEVGNKEDESESCFMTLDEYTDSIFVMDYKVDLFESRKIWRINANDGKYHTVPLDYELFNNGATPKIAISQKFYTFIAPVKYDGSFNTVFLYNKEDDMMITSSKLEDYSSQTCTNVVISKDAQYIAVGCSGKFGAFYVFGNNLEIKVKVENPKKNDKEKCYSNILSDNSKVLYTCDGEENGKSYVVVYSVDINSGKIMSNVMKDGKIMNTPVIDSSNNIYFCYYPTSSKIECVKINF